MLLILLGAMSAATAQSCNQGIIAPSSEFEAVCSCSATVPSAGGEFRKRDDPVNYFCPFEDELAVVAGSSFVYKVGVVGGDNDGDDDVDQLDDDATTCNDPVTGEVMCHVNQGDAGNDDAANTPPPYACCTSSSNGCFYDGQECVVGWKGWEWVSPLKKRQPPNVTLFPGSTMGTCQGDGNACVDCNFELDTVELLCGQVTVTVIQSGPPGPPFDGGLDGPPFDGGLDGPPPPPFDGFPEGPPPPFEGGPPFGEPQPARKRIVCTPVVEIFKDGVGKVQAVTTAGRYFLRVSVFGCEKIFERFFDATSTTCDDGLATTNRDTCIDGICVACPDPVICPGINSISVTNFDAEFVCGTVSRPAHGMCAGKYELVWARQYFGSIDLLNKFTGCVDASVTKDNTTLILTLPFVYNNKIEIPLNGICFARFIEFRFVDDVSRKRNTLQTEFVTTTLSAIVLLPTVTGSAVGDPHIVGPRGERFEFTGKPGEFYNFFSTPKYIVKARMSYENGVDARFMTRLHVQIGDVDINCDALDLFSTKNDDAVMVRINAQLAAHGAKATLLAGRHNGLTTVVAPQLVVDVCDERIVVTALHVSPRQIAALHLVTTSVIYNLQVEVAGCHDNFDGVIGQLYKCLYNKSKFVYVESAVEQQFHLDSSQHSLPRDDVEASKCLELREDGAIIGSALLKF